MPFGRIDAEWPQRCHSAAAMPFGRNDTGLGRMIAGAPTPMPPVARFIHLPDAAEWHQDGHVACARIAACLMRPNGIGMDMSPAPGSPPA